MIWERESQTPHLRRGDHVCLIYHEPPERVVAVARFLKEGLAAGERGLYIGGHCDTQEVLHALFDAGVDVPGERERGRLAVLTHHDTYLRPGRFDPDAMLDVIRDAIDGALAAGFTGLRAAGEMSWTLHPAADGARLLEYEAALNTAVAGRPAAVLCLYDGQRLPASTVHSALRTHPLAAVGTRLCPNLYYESPDVPPASGAEAAGVERMLAQLVRTWEAHHALEDAITLRDDVLSIASHDLKNPITLIKGFAQSLNRRARNRDAVSSEEVREATEYIDEAAERMNRLIDDLLNLSRLQRGRLDITPEDVDLTALARRVVARFEHAPRKTSAHRLKFVAPEQVAGTWDPARLEQVLTNLISNAIKYSPEGGEVRVTVTRDGGYAQVTVSDQGVGIPPEDQAVLFQPFGRGTGAQRTAGGVGLGLYIAAQIVRRHGGDITVDSTPGEGSTFTLRLPLRVPLPT